MIPVTRLNGSIFYINPDLIETIERTPDTVIRLTTEKRFVVREKPDEIISRIVEYKRRIYLKKEEWT